MSGTGPSREQPAQPGSGTGSSAVGTAPPASAAADRAARFNAMNMVRSLLPLLVIILLVVGWTAFRQDGFAPVRPVDPSGTVQVAAARATYPLVAPAGLPKG